MKYIFLHWVKKLAVTLSVTRQILSGIVGAVFTRFWQEAVRIQYLYCFHLPAYIAGLQKSVKEQKKIRVENYFLFCC
jgi:hypothetical protein